MIIGIDAGALSIADARLRVGVYYVTLSLLQKLSRIDAKNEYRLFSFSPVDPAVMATLGSNMRNIVVHPKIGWATLQLPLYLRRHPVDVFLGMSQFVPPSTARNIGFIYDVGFLKYPGAYPTSHMKLAKQTRDVAKRSREIITISNVSKSDIVASYGVSAQHVHVLYPGVREVFTPIGSARKEPTPYFLFVGALKPGKNVPILLAAFAEFMKKVKKPHHLVLVGGDYWRDPVIDSQIRELKLKRFIKEVGHVSDEKLAAYYRGAVALVCPSLWEGFGMPVAEAMASGCPVIASTAGALPEVVGRSGILLNPIDVLGFAKAMQKIARDKAFRKTLQAKGLKRVAKYNWEHFAERLLEIAAPSERSRNDKRKI